MRAAAIGNRIDWRCDGDAAFSVRFTSRSRTSVRRRPNLPLPHAQSGSGARYTNGSVEYWEHGGEADAQRRARRAVHELSPGLMRGYFGIGAEEISKPMNLGALMRTSHAFGASFFFTINAHPKVREAYNSDTSRSFDHMPYYPGITWTTAAAEGLRAGWRRTHRRRGRTAALSASERCGLRARPRARLALAGAARRAASTS